MKVDAVQNQVGFSVKNLTDEDALGKMLVTMHTKDSSAFNKLGIKPANIFTTAIIQPKMKNRNESKVMMENLFTFAITNHPTFVFQK